MLKVIDNMYFKVLNSSGFEVIAGICCHFEGRILKGAKMGKDVL